MIESAMLHKKKIAVGTLAAVCVFMTPYAQKTFKWYEKVGNTRTIAKTNEDSIKTLQKQTLILSSRYEEIIRASDMAAENKDEIIGLRKCERDANANITALRTLINEASKRLDRLELKVDDIPKDIH